MNTFVITFQGVLPVSVFIQSVAVETRLNPHRTDSVSVMCAKLDRELTHR